MLDGEGEDRFNSIPHHQAPPHIINNITKQPLTALHLQQHHEAAPPIYNIFLNFVVVQHCQGGRHLELSSEMYPHIESADMEIFIATLLEVLSQSSKQLPTMNKNSENIF